MTDDIIDLAGRRQAIETVRDESVARVIAAISDLLRLATNAPPCFAPSVYAKAHGDIVEVSFPLDRHVVDRLAAFVAGDPPSDEEIERAEAVIAPVARAEAEVIEAAKAWHGPEWHARYPRESALRSAVDRLLAAEKRRGEG